MKVVSNYLRNVTKSMAYVAADITKNDLAPNVAEFADSNKEFLTATYAAIKNPATTVRRGVTSIQESKVYQALDYGAKNLFEDLRTGNFYNKAREDRDIGRLSGMNADDYNDLSEFGIDDDWESKLGSEEEISIGDKKIVGAIEGSNAAATKATVNAVLAGSDYTAKTVKASTSMIMVQNDRLFAGLHQDMSVLNATMDSILKLSTATFQNIDKNTSDYFTQSLKLDTERNAILKEMLEMQRNQYTSALEKERKANNNRSKKKRWSDINVGGIADLSSYFDNVKDNVAKQLASSGLPAFSEDSNMLATFMISPMKYALEYVAKGIIPATVKQATKELDSTISGIFGNIIATLGNAASSGDNGLLSTIAKFFGVSTSVNRRIDTSKYEKGPVPFDGITRKAIIDVIPAYLRRLEAFITGNPEQVYDYNTGKWTTMHSVKRSFENIRKNAIRSGTADIRNAMADNMKTIKSGARSYDEYQSIERAQQQFDEFLYENNGIFNPNKSASDNGIESYRYPDLVTHYSKIVKAYKSFGYQRDSTGKMRQTKYSTRINSAKNVLDAKDAEERQYRALEQAATSIFGQYASALGIDTHGKHDKNGKFTAKNSVLLNTKDKYSNTIFDYLQNINKELQWQRTSGFEDVINILLQNGISYGGGSSGTTRTFNRTKVKFDDISLYNSSANSSRQNEYSNRARKNEEVKAKSLKAIAEGKAVDLRDFDVDEQAYLLYLANIMQNQSADQYEKELKGYVDANILRKFMDKNFYNPKISYMEDIEKVTKKANETGKNTYEVSTEEELNAFEKALKKVKSGSSKLAAIAGAPAEIFTNLLYSADKAIYEMMFRSTIKADGDDDTKDKYKGFMDMMASKIKETFKKVTDKLQEDIIDPLKRRLGIGDDFKDRFKNSIGGMARSAGEAFINANKYVYGPAYHEIQDAIGVKQRNTIMKQKRSNKRDQITRDISNLRNMNDLMSVEFMAQLEAYGLNPNEYDDIKDAKKDLTAAYAEALLRNSNSLSEVDDEDQLNFIFKNANLSREEMSKIAKKMGFDLTGADSDEIKNNFMNSAKSTLKNNVKNSKKNAEAGKDPSGYRRYARWNGFKGSAEEKKDILRSVLRSRGMDDSIVDSIQSEEDLDRAFVMYQNAKGTVSGVPFMGNTMLSKGELLFNEDGITRVNKTDAYRIDKPTHILNSRDSHDLLTGLGVKGLGPKTTLRQDIGRENLAKKKLIESIPNNAAGDINIDNPSDLSVDEIANEVKNYLPEGLAGGVVGALLSTVLGIVGGPLLGAAVGAGASFISSSDTFKNAVFGPMGDDGYRKGGIVPKSITDAITKHLPDMTKYGLAGIIPGLLTPLGPVGGTLVGGAIGFLKSNEDFKETFFGKNGIISEDCQKILKKMLPNTAIGAGVGAAATLFGGPFGLLGNAAIGAAIGMMTSTDEFKDGILGKEINGVREGGLVSILKDCMEPLATAGAEFRDALLDIAEKNVADPLKRFFEPAIHALPQVAAIIPRLVNNYFEEHFGRSLTGMIKDVIVSPFKKIMDKIVTPVGTRLLKGITTPIRALGWVGDKIRGHQINTGNASYMTAEERNTWRVENGKETDATDEALSKIGAKGGMSVADAVKMRDDLRTINDTVGSVRRDKKASERQIEEILNTYTTESGKSLSPKAKKKIRSAINRGRPEEVAKIIQDDGFTRNQFNDLLYGKGGDASTQDPNSLNELLKANKNYRNQINTMKNMTDEEKNRILGSHNEALKKLGIDPSKLTNSHEIDKIIANLTTEIDRNYANPQQEAEKVAIETTNSENLQSLADDVHWFVEYVKNARNNFVDGLDEQRFADDSITDAAAAATDHVYDNRARAHDPLNRYTDEARDTFTSNDDFIRGGNKNQRVVNKLNLNYTDINAAGGKKLNRLNGIKKYGYTLTEKAIKYLVSVTDVKYRDMRSFLKKKAVIAITGDRPLTDEDLKFASKHIGKKRSAFVKRCEALLAEGATPDDFKSFADIEKRSGTVTDMMGGPANPEDREEPSEAEDTDQTTALVPYEAGAVEAVPNHGIGTFLLGGALNLGKKLLGFGAKKAKDTAGGAMNKALAAISSFGISSADKRAATADGPAMAGNTGSDVDIPGDGRSIVTNPATMESVMVKRNSSGDVEPDTANSHTKDVMKKIGLREQAAEKLQAAQMKACEVIKNAFDVSDMKESKNGKFNWWQVLLIGGLLAKSGILGQIFTNVVKPIWTKLIYPWITDKAVPWIVNTAIPKILEGISALGGIIAEAIGGLAKTIWENFPGIIKGTINLAGKTLDIALGIDTNSGETNTLDESDPTRQTTITDTSGKQLTVEEIRTALENGETLKNEQGADVVLNEDGTISSTDESIPGAGYLKNALPGIAKTFIGGNANQLIPAAISSASSVLMKHGGIVGKVAGGIGKVATAPINLAGNLGAMYQSRLAKKAATLAFENSGNILESGAKMIGNSVYESADDLVKDTVTSVTTRAATGNKLAQTVRNGYDTIKDVVLGKEIGSSATSRAWDVAESATNIEKNASRIGEITTALREWLVKLFGNSKVLSVAKSAADFLHITDVAKWVASLPTKVEGVITKYLSSAIEKEGSGAVAKILGNFNVIFKVITSIYAFAKGADQAESMLGVLETTPVEELVCGITAAVCNLIPILELGKNAIAKGILSLFGDDLTARQQEADALVEQYNSEQGGTTTYTTEEYLARNNSVTGAIGAKIGDGLSKLKDSAIGGLKSVGGAAIDGVKNVVGGVADTVGNVVDNFRERVTARLDIVKTLLPYVTSGDLSGLCSYNAENIGDDDPAAKAQNSLIGSVKLGLFMPTLISFLAHKIGDFVGNIVTNVASVATTVGSVVAAHGSYILAGDVDSFYAVNKSGEDFPDTVGSVASTVIKVIGTPALMVSHLVHRAADLIGNIVSGIASVGSTVGNVVSTYGSYILAGDVDSFYATNSDGEDFPGAVGNVTSSVIKVIGTPALMVSSLVHHAADTVSNIIDKISNSVPANVVSTYFGYVLAGDSDSFYADVNENDDISGNMSSVVARIVQIVGTPFMVVSNIIHGIADAAKTIIDNIRQIFDNVFQEFDEIRTDPLAYFSNLLFGDSNDSSASGATVDTVTSASGSFGKGKYSKQIDPDVSNVRYNAPGDTEYQTIGDSGCGPAAAVTAMQSMYGKGNEVVNAAKFAVSHGYKERDGGTKPGFFSDYFKRNGYGSQTTTNKAQLERNIRSGAPTVIMGRDSNGVSNSTPFGSTPHYVTVTGTDNRGRAIVQDPESKYDNQIYDMKTLMSKTSLGVSAFGKGNRRVRNRVVKYGRGDTAAQVWYFLKSKGCTDQAAAGIMGNLQQESSMNPAMIQGNGKGPAAGICQWENYNKKSGRWKAMSDYATSKGVSWQDLTAQLEWMWLELNGKDATTASLLKKNYGGLTGLTSCTDINKACDIFEKTFERAGKPMMSNRYKYAKQFYDKYKGTQGEALSGVTSDGSVTTTTTSSNSSNVLLVQTTYEDSEHSIGSMLSEAIKNSKAGQVVNSFLGTGTRRRRNAKYGRGGTFPTYNLNETQLKGIANILRNEQGDADGWAAEASLMANLTDEQGDAKATVNNLISTATGGWFAKGKSRYTNPGNVPQEVINVAKSVLVEGKRTLPRYIDEHDCTSDISSLTLNGKSVSKSDKSNYVQHQSKIKNVYGSDWTFYAFPSANSDPFGYKYDSLRKKWGDDCYGSVSDSGEVSSDGTTTDDSASNQGETIGAFLKNVMSNSKAAQVLNSFLDVSSSSSSSSSGDSSSSSSGSISGGDAAAFVAAAKKDVGYKETGSNNTKYGEWYGLNGQPWCAMFVSYKANEAGISTDVIPKFSYCPDGYNWFKSRGQTVKGTEATTGDIIFYNNGSRMYHTGIVEGRSGDTVYTVEGNSSDMVAERKRSTTDSSLYYGRPKFATTGTTAAFDPSSSNATSDSASYSNTRGSNGYKPLSKYGMYRDTIYGKGSPRPPRRIISGYDENHNPIHNEVTDRETFEKNTGSNFSRGVYGRGTALIDSSTNINYTPLIQAIIQTLVSIADNTDKLNTIVSILNDKLGIQITEQDISDKTINKESVKTKIKNALKNSPDSNIGNFMDDADNSSINTIIAAMNAIASE